MADETMMFDPSIVSASTKSGDSNYEGINGGMIDLENSMGLFKGTTLSDILESEELKFLNHNGYSPVL